jgi:hypothetical protein
MAPGAKRTTDHATIRRWVEARGGRPASVAGTQRSGEEAGILRIDFPDRGHDEKLTPISWDEFFQKFEESRLAFLYQNDTSNGRLSRFSRFVSRSAK